LVANWPEHVLLETTHMEVHPSTILGLLGNMIPFPNHNQSPRNQLGSSQSKQGLSIYSSNWKLRYDNTANILCYGQMPLTRTIYQDYSVNIYPNPFQNELNCIFYTNKNEILEVHLYDVIGHLILAKKVNAMVGKNNINLLFNQPLAEGIYNIIIKGEEKQYAKKIISSNK
jgi:hypothetical protein